MISEEKSEIILNVCSSIGKVFSPSGYFQDVLFIFDFVKFEDDMPRCWVVFKIYFDYSNLVFFDLPGYVVWCLTLIWCEI